MALDKQQLVRLYIQRIVHSLIPDEYGEEFIHSVTNDLTAKLSTPAATTNYDINQVLNNYKTYFLSRGDNESWSKFQNLLDQLSVLKSADEIIKYLVFFSTLQSTNDSHRASDTNTFTHKTDAANANSGRMVSPNPNVFRLSPHVQPPSLPTRLSTMSPQPHHSSAFPFPKPFNDPVESGPATQHAHHSNTSFPRLRTYQPISRRSSISSRNSSVPPALHHSQLHLNEPNINSGSFTMSLNKPLAECIGPYYQNPEPVLLQYISYTLLGLDSKVFQFDDESNKLILPAVNTSYGQLLGAIGECALLYRVLNNFIKTKGQLNSPIKMAYLTVVEQQLSAYVSHINQLFTTTPSSLIFVYNSVFEWIYSLRLLYYLVQQLSSNGYDFLAQVYDLTKFGDLRIKSLSTDIVQTIGRPYYEIFEHWIIRGELIDESNEYFIRFEKTNNFNDIIKYDPEKVPIFLPQSLGTKIYQIGKMLIFLGKYCKELRWIENYSNKYSNIIYRLNNGTQSMSINEISQLINLQYDELLKHLTTIIHGKPNELIQHLENFKKFYFMENNDFFETVISSGQELFNESSTNISSNQLSKLLSDSIAFTSSKNNPYNFRLDARVLDPIHGNLGWDVFTIEYRIDDLPIQYLMHSQMMQYLKMFNFLWKVKQLHFLLHQNFQVANNIRKVELHQVQKTWVKNKWSGEKSARFKKIRWVVKSFNTISIIRFQLNNFINALTKHLSFDVIESNYQTNILGKFYKSINQEPELANINPEFIKQLTTHSDTFESTEVTPQNIKELTIDELIHIHETYLSSITKSKIFSDVDEGKFTGLTYSSQVFSLLELVFQFIKSSEEYYHLIINYMLVLNIDEQAMVMDQDIVLLERSLNTIFKKIHNEIYQSNFQYQLNQFVKDMRGDFELREVSKIFS